jgi:exosortase A-associated hydrolase 1/exosortase A-associated hydrolase 2
MTSPNNPSVRLVCIEGSRGLLAATYFPPATKRASIGDILLAPAFAEEMNRCRAMVAMQARRFAQMGIGTLVLDLYGTGDSSGEFSDGSWSVWLDDLARGVEWLRAHANGCGTVWGIRTGAILACGIARRDSGISNVLLWQPVINGKAYFTQFLRIRIAAEIEQADGVRNTEALRKLAASGEPLEVSGYQIGSALARELDVATVSDSSAMAGKQIIWCEVVGSDDSSVPRANEKLVNSYREGGVRVDMEIIQGPAFWNLHERVEAPELLDATSRLVSTWVGEKSTATPTTPEDRTNGLASIDPMIGTGCVMECIDDQLTGVLHAGKTGQRRGIVIVVAGGPQYRIGAHRQFVALARRLSALGYPVLRFDLRGMGDSSGSYLGFQRSEPDIRAAIDCLTTRQPQIDEVVLFGECESASGILFYAHKDPRVKGIVLVNPWVRTEGGRAEAIIKHYYLDRLRSPELWRNIRSGQFNPIRSLRSLIQVVWTYVRGRAIRRLSGDTHEDLASLPLPVATGVGLRRFEGAVLILMSGRDYIAREFDEVVKSSRAWEGLLDRPNVQRHVLKDADHTFSKEIWKQQAANWVRDWIASW